MAIRVMFVAKGNGRTRKKALHGPAIPVRVHDAEPGSWRASRQARGDRAQMRLRRKPDGPPPSTLQLLPEERQEAFKRPVQLLEVRRREIHEEPPER